MDKKHGQFQCLREWAEDPSCGVLVAKELHQVSGEAYGHERFRWMTKSKLFSEVNAYVSSEAMRYAMDRMGGCKSRPNRATHLKATVNTESSES